ncbi:MAG TPA: diacylglycerol kinase family protein [Williamwhitmania sp.]|nr:diacylglycerol kinase family protein [Williamwhitmania sp.]
MENNSWKVIINPKAGSGRGHRDWPVIKALLESKGLQFDFEFTRKRYHAVELTVRAINEGYYKIIAVGGDGTVNEIVNGIFIQKAIPTTNVLLGTIAVGTGNDWARTYKLPWNYTDAIEALMMQRDFLQDVGLASFFETRVHHTRYFANAVGIGFDGAVGFRFNRLKELGRKGKWLYVMALVHALIQYRSTSVSAKIDERGIKSEIFSATLGIGKFNGGGMLQVPDAISDDGLFDMTIIRKLSKWNVLRNLPILYNGKIYEHPKISVVRAKSISIHSIPPMPMELDGEAVGHSPFEFKIVPKSIRVVVGATFQEQAEVLPKR